jgi:hypothetical protein
MIFNELPISFPWYEVQNRQTRFKKNFEGMDPWGLISPKNSLLPFQIRNSEGFPPTAWIIRNIETGAVTDISAAIGAIRQTVLTAAQYWYFPGSAITGLDLAPGFYESVITWTTETHYSEIFRVPVCSFTAGAVNTEFLKIEWYNKSDIPPIFYNDLDGGGIPYFRNVIYLDSFIHASEPRIEEEGEEDGDGETVITFQKAIFTYRITELVPDFLKKALVLLQIHDFVFITPVNSPRSGQVKRATVTATLEFGGAFSAVEIAFNEEVETIKKACADNMG